MAFALDIFGADLHLVNREIYTQNVLIFTWKLPNEESLPWKQDLVYGDNGAPSRLPIIANIQTRSEQLEERFQCNKAFST